jgi:hypothetical protein
MEGAFLYIGSAPRSSPWTAPSGPARCASAPPVAGCLPWRRAARHRRRRCRGGGVGERPLPPPPAESSGRRLRLCTATPPRRRRWCRACSCSQQPSQAATPKCDDMTSWASDSMCTARHIARWLARGAPGLWLRLRFSYISTLWRSSARPLRAVELLPMVLRLRHKGCGTRGGRCHRSTQVWMCCGEPLTSCS